jgi:ABC-type transport system involved in cytochrome bd biosynthesis fused ATPase/permease subunit
VFELLSPLVEILGLIGIVVAAVLGMLAWKLAILFAVAALGYGLLLSIIAIVVDEISYDSYHRWRDIFALLGAAVIENVGFRQLHAVWRLHGLWQGLRLANAEWGEMPRVGYTDASAAA